MAEIAGPGFLEGEGRYGLFETGFEGGVVGC
jgi:hypothetical protein